MLVGIPSSVIFAGIVAIVFVVMWALTNWYNRKHHDDVRMQDLKDTQRSLNRTIGHLGGTTLRPVDDGD